MRASSIVLAMSIVGCGHDYPPVTWSGEHLEYASGRDGELCEGTYYLLDRFVEQLSQLVGVSLSDPVLFAYIDEARVGEFCTVVPSSGCADERTAISTKALSRHEITHVVTAAAGWEGPAPFVEGVAEMFNDGVDLKVERVSVDEVLDDFKVVHPHYFTMGLFVRFLVERHSLDELAGFMRATDYNAPRKSYESTFAQHFGEPLSRAIAAFEGYPTCPEWSNRIALYECSLPLTPWHDDAIELSVELECAAADVFGPIVGDTMQIGAHAAFEVATDGAYAIQVSSDLAGFAGVRITRCGSCWDEVDIPVAAGGSKTAELPAGRYYATFVARTSAPGRVDLRLAASP